MLIIYKYTRYFVLRIRFSPFINTRKMYNNSHGIDALMISWRYSSQGHSLAVCTCVTPQNETMNLVTYYSEHTILLL